MTYDIGIVGAHYIVSFIMIYGITSRHLLMQDKLCLNFSFLPMRLNVLWSVHNAGGIIPLCTPEQCPDLLMRTRAVDCTV